MKTGSIHIYKCLPSEKIIVHQVGIKFSSEKFLKPYNSAIITSCTQEKSTERSYLVEVVPKLSIRDKEIICHPLLFQYLSSTVKLSPIPRNERKVAGTVVIEVKDVSKDLREYSKFPKMGSLLNTHPKTSQLIGQIFHRRFYGKLVMKNCFLVTKCGNSCCLVYVSDVSNGNVVGRNTQIDVKIDKSLLYDDVEESGFEKNVKLSEKGLRELLIPEFLFRKFDSFISKAFENQRSCNIVFYGVSGIGKTWYCERLKEYYHQKHANSDCLIDWCDCSLILRDFQVKKRERFTKIVRRFVNSQQNKILFLDNYNVLNCTSSQNEEFDDDHEEENDRTQELLVKTQVVFMIRDLLDQLEISHSSKHTNGVVVIMICNDISEVGVSTRMRVRNEIFFPSPDLQTREKILRSMSKKKKQNKLFEDEIERNKIISKVAACTPNFISCDLLRVVRLAYFHSQKTSSLSKNKFVKWEDFEYSISLVQPSQLQNLSLQVPNVAWDDIGGYEKIKKRVKEIIYGPLEKFSTYKKLNLPICTGLLMHGPSGCGKTLIIKALSSFKKMNYISIKSSEIFSRYTGETEEIIRNLFSNARKLSPCVLVFDEIDSLTPKRSDDFVGSSTDSGASRRALSQLLNEMDGIQSRQQVFIVGCTNRIDLIDDAVLRPGRLDQIIHVPKPNLDDRYKILKTIVFSRGRGMKVEKQIDFMQIAKSTDGFTGADLESLCREAGLEAMRENINAKFISEKNFQQALASLK